MNPPPPPPSPPPRAHPALPKGGTQAVNQPLDPSMVDNQVFPRPFGKYTLLRLLGMGGMAEVYLAQQHQPKRFVAIKIPKDLSALTPEVRTRFAEEAHLVGQLDHPGIVPLFDVGEEGGVPYFTMAYVEGQTLRAHLRDTPLTLHGKIDLFCNLCKIVGSLHAQRLIHGDIKPDNIMVDQYGNLRLLDFGVVRALTPLSSPESAAPPRFATREYMAPEMLAGAGGETGPQADVYALGVVLFELLTGHLPFPRTPDANLWIRQLLETPAPKPSEAGADVPAEWDDVVANLLAKNPHERPRDAKACLRLVEGRTKSPGISPVAPPGEDAPAMNAPLPKGMAMKASNAEEMIDKATEAANRARNSWHKVAYLLSFVGLASVLSGAGIYALWQKYRESKAAPALPSPHPAPQAGTTDPAVPPAPASVPGTPAIPVTAATPAQVWATPPSPPATGAQPPPAAPLAEPRRVDAVERSLSSVPTPLWSTQREWLAKLQSDFSLRLSGVLLLESPKTVTVEQRKSDGAVQRRHRIVPGQPGVLVLEKGVHWLVLGPGTPEAEGILVRIQPGEVAYLLLEH